MPVLIVGEEKTFAQLKSRVFRGRVSRAANRRVTDAVREANPHVDITDLRPGTILTIPDLPEVSVEGELSADEVPKRALDEVHSALVTAINAIGKTSAAGVKEERAARAKVAKALKDPGVAKARRIDKDLAADIEVVTAALAQDEEQTKAGAAALKKATGQWAGELEELRALLD